MATSDRTPGRARRHARLLALVMAAMITMAAAKPPTGPRFAELDHRLDGAFITPEGDDTYALTAEDEHGDGRRDMVVTAAALPSNQGSNTRVAFWRRATRKLVDQESCATWSNNTSTLRQPGAALRIREHRGRMQAITVTQNVWFHGFWVFNVHIMDSGADPAFVQIGGFDLSGVLIRDGVLLPYPWRMCARVVGDVVSFKVWPLIDPEPAWDDPAYGASVRLPDGWEISGWPGWERPGRAGWYVGHLEPGQSMQFSDMTTAAVVPVGSPPEVDTVPLEPTTVVAEPIHVERAP